MKFVLPYTGLVTERVAVGISCMELGPHFGFTRDHGHGYRSPGGSVKSNHSILPEWLI